MSKIWEELSEESKKKILDVYAQSRQCKESSNVEWGRCDVLEDLFGEDNLIAMAKVRTVKIWEDVCLYYSDINDILVNISDFLAMDDVGAELFNKITATFKIQKLIELGSYGGVVTDEEWKDSTILKYVIGRHRDFGLTCAVTYSFKSLVAFHTKEQRDEFFQLNRELLETYFEM